MSGKEFIAFTAILMSLVAVSIDALLPALGLIAVDLMVEDANRVQLLISALFLGLAAGQLICGPLSDAFGRKPVLYCGLGVYFIGTFICYFANDLTALLIGRLVQGLGVSAPNITAISLVRDKYHGREMAKIMSLVMMIFILVPAVAPSLGQAILLFADWRTVFVLYAVYALVIFLWVFFRLQETLSKEQRIPFTAVRLRSGFNEVISNRSTANITLCMGLVFGCLIAYINSCQQIFQVQFHVGKMFSVYFGVLALFLGGSSMLNSRIVEKHGMRYISSCALTNIVIVSAMFALIQQIIDVQLWMFLLYAAILFFSFGLIFGNLNAMAMEPMGHVAGIAAAVIGSVSSIMSLTIGTLIGQLYDGSVMPITLGVLIITSIALMLLHNANYQTSSAGL